MAKTVLLLIPLCCSLLVMMGCQKPYTGVEVIVEGDGQFPAFLVGTWKENKYDWEFVFGPDGTISSAVLATGGVRVYPGKNNSAIRNQGWTEASFKLGTWSVEYSPQKRELAVEIVVEDYSIMVDEEGRGLTGHSTDWFIGPVSESPLIWEADWYTFPKHILLNPEPAEFPFDPNDNPVTTLVFRKQQKMH